MTNPDGSTPPDESATHVDGPSPPPRGLGSLAVVPSSGVDAGLRLTSLPMPLAHLSEVSVAAFTSLAGQSVRIDLGVRGGSSGNSWAATRALPADADTWTAVDFTPLKFNWFAVEGGLSYNDLTMAEFVDAVGPSEGGQLNLVFLVVHAGGCSLTPKDTIYYFDDLRVGVDGVSTVYDFEGPSSTTTTTISLGSTTITAGGRSTVTAQVGAPGTVELLARPAGRSTFSIVATTTTDSAGQAVVFVAPTVTTTYQWRYLGAPRYAASSSGLQALGVRSRASIGVADRTVAVGGRLVARGQVTPSAPGTKVALWRALPDGRRRLIGTSRVDTRGRYAVAALATSRGTWKVFTTVAATSTNLSGLSRTIAVSVS